MRKLRILLILIFIGYVLPFSALATTSLISPTLSNANSTGDPNNDSITISADAQASYSDDFDCPNGFFAYIYNTAQLSSVTVSNAPGSLNGLVYTFNTHTDNIGHCPGTYSSSDDGTYGTPDRGSMSLTHNVSDIAAGTYSGVILTLIDSGGLTTSIPVTVVISHPNPTTCTDPTANNNGQSGACTYTYGCTDPAATNYNPAAGVDDGSCTYPPATGTVCIQSNVTTHVNTSGGIGYSDDIAGGAGYTCHGNASLDTYTVTGSSLGGYTGPTYNSNPQPLSSNGQTIYFDLGYTTSSVPGCTDSTASNYNPSANLNDGSCTYNCPAAGTRSCTSGANTCGQIGSGTQTQIDCNTTNGTWTNWSACTATPPPTPPPTTCTATNECGQTADATATCGNTCTATPPTNTCIPAASIGANPNPVSYGGSSTISWTCNNSSDGSVPGITSTKTVSGTTVTGTGSTGALTSNTTYTVTCTGFNGTNPTASVTVNVSGPTCNIDGNGTAGPITVVYGSSPIINWACSNSGSGTVTPPNWTGVTGSQHTGSLTIPGTYVYTATCSGNGTASCNEFVTAQPPVPCVGSCSINNPPTYSAPDYCSSGPGGYVAWGYEDPAGSPQTAYEIQISTTGEFSSPFYGSGKLLSSSHVFSIPNSVLQFGLGYKSRVRVWNSYDVASAWSGPTNTFNTPNYAYPDVVPPYQFTWPTVPKPQQSKPLQFTDHAAFGGGNSNQHSWSWDFGDGGTSTAQNPAHTYSAIGNFIITQTVTDAGNQTCSYAQSLNVQKPIPIIKEVAPK